MARAHALAPLLSVALLLGGCTATPTAEPTHGVGSRAEGPCRGGDECATAAPDHQATGPSARDDLGASVGCHLHFEVRPRRGSCEDAVNPRRRLRLRSAPLAPPAPLPSRLEPVTLESAVPKPGTGKPVPSAPSRAVTADLTESVKAVKTPGRRVRVVRVRGTRYRPVDDVPAPPPMRARAWAVVDMRSGHILGKHRARARLPQASTIKLLSALTAMRRVPANRPVRATRMAADTPCSCAGVNAGRRYTRGMLLVGMLLPSGNDAAEALAGGDPRGRGRFIRAMNSTAQRLGATDTVARNPSGLDARGAHSSARDLLVFLRAASRRAALRRWLDQPTTRFGALRGPRHRLYATTDYMHMYDASYAAKNGYTSNARNTLAVATRIRGRSIGVAVLGGSGDITSGAHALTVWARRAVNALRPVGRLPIP